MADSYWESRVAEDEAHAQRIINRYDKLQKKTYQQALKIIDMKIDRLYIYVKYDKPEMISRTELWQYNQYLELRDAIQKELGITATKQITFTENAINEVYRMVLGVDINNNTHLTNLADFGVKKVINSHWTGRSFSERIYNNTQVLANRLNNLVTDMVLMGRSPDELKKEIMAEFGVSYNQASRLIRTETAYAFNQASIDRYKNSNVNKVEVMVEADACEQCLELDGQEFEINCAPILPIHPNCRCCYLPIVD